jgi:hypothetical protein
MLFKEIKLKPPEWAESHEFMEEILQHSEEFPFTPKSVGGNSHSWEKTFDVSVVERPAVRMSS